MNHPQKKTYLYHKEDGEAITFHDTQESWRFWYLIPNRVHRKNSDWLQYLKPLADIHSIECFWVIVEMISSIELPKGCRYYVFKTDHNGHPVSPLWENEVFKFRNGPDGTIENAYEINFEWNILETNPPDATAPQPTATNEQTQIQAHERWLDLVLSIIGQTNAFWDERLLQSICGIEFNNRGQCLKVGIWTYPISEAIRTQLEKALKAVLQLSSEEKLNIFKIGDEKVHQKPMEHHPKPENHQNHQNHQNHKGKDRDHYRSKNPKSNPKSKGNPNQRPKGKN